MTFLPQYLSAPAEKNICEDCLRQLYTNFQTPEKFRLSSQMNFKSRIFKQSD